MAYVVSATWTTEPGQEDVVRDAIEKLTPPSRAEQGNVFYQAYQDPAEPSVFRLFEIYADEEAYAVHGASDHFKTFALEQAIPVLANRERRSTRPSPELVVRLAAFRRTHDEPDARFVGLVLGQGDHLRVHPFDAGADLVELLAETPEWREAAPTSRLPRTG